MFRPPPLLSRHATEGIAVWSDAALAERSGIVLGFTERTGGVSEPPRDTLNLAAHVGDDPGSVDENRQRLFRALGMPHLRHRLVTAEQVHGEAIVVATSDDEGRGACAASGRAPVPATDALVTRAEDIPLLMLYADCVPVVIVSEQPRAVAVVHAGWRGALASLPGKAAGELAEVAGVSPGALAAYIGPHIDKCCYEVDEILISRFVNTFDTIAAVDGRLDLHSAVVESLASAGLGREMIASVGICTFDHTEAFFSYRAGETTGRHGALAVITKVG